MEYLHFFLAGAWSELEDGVLTTLSSRPESPPTRMDDGKNCEHLASPSQSQAEVVVPSVGEPLLSRDRGVLQRLGDASLWKTPDSLTACLVFDGDTDGVS